MMIEYNVRLNYLEVMALLMLVHKQESDGGLSEPEKTAKEKLDEANTALQTVLRDTW